MSLAEKLRVERDYFRTAELLVMFTSSDQILFWLLQRNICPLFIMVMLTVIVKVISVEMK